MSDILSKFTTHYQKIIGLALTYAQGVGRDTLDVTDLLLALASERGSLAAEILERHGLTPVSLHQKCGHGVAVPAPLCWHRTFAGSVGYNRRRGN
ncbi:MAG: hypothetical protein UV05_C0010G0004 [candidate division CPR1 bacterium GW2011_GWA2_42_17]|uniref:Clp R domain-containing protein n=1 Tax=candidate division CPR1 bacterium GW2011_GWA2_42_17 TaxID=1618341 RepID=A0A0G1C3G0_9BACT|nr:MAG: hypothetical protein UV05_C0010G0004 [candidate division CPR1 bacterium GW2011_GWA2_42_17]